MPVLKRIAAMERMPDLLFQVIKNKVPKEQVALRDFFFQRVVTQCDSLADHTRIVF